MSGLAKSRSTQASAIASVNSTQYASRALRLMTSFDAKVHAWHAQVAAQDAKADPTQENANMVQARPQAARSGRSEVTPEKLTPHSCRSEKGWAVESASLQVALTSDT